MLDRSQELFRQAIDERLDNMDFSSFWQGVEDKLSQQRPSRTERFQIWFDSWRALWTWRAPAWTAASIALITGAALLFSRTPSSPPLEIEEQAHIESLSASDTVSVWSEPTSNATVIWVSDEGEGM
jgi:anti-sigma-K factor RskA